jgi:hypothetical protein
VKRKRRPKAALSLSQSDLVKLLAIVEQFR